jgi:glycosyltransferase involved in cell wall biosynthesis
MINVLVVGQTPPPYGGQAMMIHRLVHSELEGVKIVHVRMGFSSSMGEIGRFRLSKLFHLISLITQITYHRVVNGARVLYYPPGGPQKVPMFRDIVLLGCTRWMFDKTIFHFHASGLAELYVRLPEWQRVLFRAAYFDVDAAVRISELTPEDGELIEAQREFIVPNGIDDPWPNLPERSNAPASVDRPLQILYVGVLHEGKGLLTLVNACQRLNSNGVEFQLQLMGQPESEGFLARLQARIAAAEIGQQVRFLGVLNGEDKWAAYARADVLCHPTYYDTVPVVVLEAMASGLPVVSTNHSGVPSLVDDGHTGLLVNPRDDSALAEALRLVAIDGHLRLSMGTAGRARFEREFTLAIHIERIRRVFLEVGNAPAAETAAHRVEAVAAS